MLAKSPYLANQLCCRKQTATMFLQPPNLPLAITFQTSLYYWSPLSLLIAAKCNSKTAQGKIHENVLTCCQKETRNFELINAFRSQKLWPADTVCPMIFTASDTSKKKYRHTQLPLTSGASSTVLTACICSTSSSDSLPLPFRRFFLPFLWPLPSLRLLWDFWPSSCMYLSDEDSPAKKAAKLILSSAHTHTATLNADNLFVWCRQPCEESTAAHSQLSTHTHTHPHPHKLHSDNLHVWRRQPSQESSTAHSQLNTDTYTATLHSGNLLAWWKQPVKKALPLFSGQHIHISSLDSVNLQRPIFGMKKHTHTQTHTRSENECNTCNQNGEITDQGKRKTGLPQFHSWRAPSNCVVCTCNLSQMKTNTTNSHFFMSFIFIMCLDFGILCLDFAVIPTTAKPNNYWSVAGAEAIVNPSCQHTWHMQWHSEIDGSYPVVNVPGTCSGTVMSMAVPGTCSGTVRLMAATQLST